MLHSALPATSPVAHLEENAAAAQPGLDGDEQKAPVAARVAGTHSNDGCRSCINFGDGRYR